MSNEKTIWCKIKNTVTGILISSILGGIGFTAYHIINSESINAQQTADIHNAANGIKALDEKIDSTQPAAIAEKIKSLEQNQGRLEAKIDYNEQIRREQHQQQLQRQDKIYELLLELKNNR